MLSESTPESISSQFIIQTFPVVASALSTQFDTLFAGRAHLSFTHNCPAARNSIVLTFAISRPQMTAIELHNMEMELDSDSRRIQKLNLFETEKQLIPSFARFVNFLKLLQCYLENLILKPVTPPLFMNMSGRIKQSGRCSKTRSAAGVSGPFAASAII